MPKVTLVNVRNPAEVRSVDARSAAVLIKIGRYRLADPPRPERPKKGKALQAEGEAGPAAGQYHRRDMRAEP